MSERAVFLNCIGISAILHTAMFAVAPIPAADMAHAPKRSLEVAYQKNIPFIAVQKESIEQKTWTGKPIEPLKKNAVTEWVKKDLIPKSTENAKQQAEPIQNRFEPKKSISLINIPGETFKSPEYKSYYQIIREKIKREAYAHYKNLEEGEVFLSFILASDGSVKDLIVNNQKTTASPSLIDIANRSVKESSPFPGFPEKLKTNPQLSFNVIISFEFK
jgi:hypothetical protein